MRKIWILLFCIGFSMWGSLVPATHTSAHANVLDVAAHENDHAHHHAHDFVSVDSGGSHEPTDSHPGDHGAELHVVAICLEVAGVCSPGALKAEKFYFGDLRYPSTVIPPEPDPDRA